VPVPLIADQRVRLPLPTTLGECYTVVALGSRNLDNLDLRILDDEGQVVAWDDAPTRDASVQACPGRAGDFTVEVHAAAGQGEARVATFSGDEARIGGHSGLWLGERRAGAQEARDGSEVSASEDERASALGWRPAAREQASLGGGEAMERRLSLPARRCSLIVAAGARGIGALRLRVLDPAGRAMVERGGHSPRVAARLCPAQATEVAVQIIARRGQGQLVFGHYTKDVPEAVATLESESARLRGDLLDALEGAEGAGYTLAERRTVGASTSTNVSASGCVRFSAIARSEGGSVALTLTREGSLRDRDVGPMATVVSCGERGATLTVDPLGGDGRIELLRFERR
jgi:hypothetical protein